ncbi:MAG: response regulator transcription factor [Lewinellaceae bacterium]|nr:response regulator transcription factor [Saprospiraceae bacterium]MCB9337659.1 response regulator transcription factor [Lewinellaceae bacterium]
MKILLVEDEQPAAKRLASLLDEHCPEGEVLVDMLESVEASVKWLKSFPMPDLIFMDIQLADGLSFDIFKQVNVTAPVIFTTAFDQYTLAAFKVNSIDYLLKPIDPDELIAALQKFKRFFQKAAPYDRSGLEQMLQSLLKKEQYKERFLVKSGQHFLHVNVGDIAYFFSEDGVAFAQHSNGKKHIVEYTLDQLESALDPGQFFRINRQMIVRPEAIVKISTWFNSRLKLEMGPPCEANTIVSRERVNDFKNWLDR